MSKVALISCLKINPDMPATSSARKTKVKNMAYSFSIHGLPRHVAKQPKSPKITMMAPVPMRTYGALVPMSEVRERYARLTFPDTPTANRITPVNQKMRL